MSEHVPRSRCDGGFALLIAVIAVMMLGLGVVALDLAVSRASATAVAAQRATAAQAAALNGLARAHDEWPRGWRTMAVGSSDSRTYAIDGFTVAVDVNREDPAVYRFSTTATGPSGRWSRAFRADRRSLSVPWRSPIVSLGTVRLAPGTTLNATDVTPSVTTDCAPANGDTYGVLVTAPGRVQLDQPADGVNYTGSQAMVAVDNQLAANVTGIMPFLDELVALANFSYAPGTTIAIPSGGPTGIQCLHWGSPYSLNGCSTHYPIIYAQGALTLTDNSGQGLLIADGPVRLTGSTRFVGLIVVRSGSLLLENAAVLHGRALVLDAAGQVSVTGAAAVYRGDCPVDRLNLGRALSRPIMRSSYVDMMLGRDVR